MTATFVLPVEVDAGHDAPDLFHTVCCRDADAAFCGSDVMGMRFTEGDGELVCVVCADLERRCDETGVCPIDNRSCPW